MSIELRLAVPEETAALPPRLQFRQLGVGGLGTWSEWADVPVVAVKTCPRTGNHCRSNCYGHECWMKAKESVTGHGGVIASLPPMGSRDGGGVDHG